MSRCVVSLLLVPCVLLSQMAPLALAHAHSGSEPAGHDLRPHAHTSLPRPSYEHEHDHSHDGHRHDHVIDPNESFPLPITLQPAPQSDHDSDAVYVASEDQLSDSRSAGDEGRVLSLTWTTVARAAGPIRKDACRLGKPLDRPPPGGACPIYVRHLAILI